MTDKAFQLKKEIRHNETLLEMTDKAIEESKKTESLMLMFVSQAERIEDKLDQLKRQLMVETMTKGKSAKGKTNAKSSKKRTKSRR
jgi:uncharacterized membrane protein YheB (UPF0754 family)